MPTPDVWRVSDLAKHACPDWDFLEIRPTDPEAECCLCQWVTKPEYDKLAEENAKLRSVLQTIATRALTADLGGLDPNSSLGLSILADQALQEET